MQHLVIKRRAEALKQGGHQAEVAPAVEALEGIRGEVELKGPRVTICAGDGLLGEPDVSALCATCQPWVASAAANVAGSGWRQTMSRSLPGRSSPMATVLTSARSLHCAASASHPQL